MQEVEVSMLRTQNNLYLVLSLLVGFFFFIHPTQTFAQQCTGSSSSACGTQQLASCPIDTSLNNQPNAPYYYCQYSWGSSLAGYTCNAAYPGGAYTCEACVPTPQSCALGGTCITYTVTSGGRAFTRTSCTLCAPQTDTPTAPGGCPQGSGGYNYNACTSGCTTLCTSGAVNCGACTGGSQPTNTCGYTTGSQTCQHNSPQTCTNSPFGQPCSPSNYNNCSTNYTCPSGAGYQQPCVTNINVHVFSDYNHNGIQDSGEPNLAGVSVLDGGGNTNTTDSNGNTTFTGKTSGSSYKLTANAPAGYQSSSTDPYTLNLTSSNGNTTVNFAMAPLFTISGHVYVDYGHDGTQNGTDPSYQVAGLNVSDGTTTAQTDANGNFTFSGMLSGTYTITLQTIPAGYQGVTTSTQVAVGPSATTAVGITPLYQISGNIFNDVDQSHCYNPSTSGCTYQGYTNPPGSDTLFTNGSHLKITGTTTGTISTTANASNGVYTTTQTLPSGTYTVSYDTGTTPLPLGYRFVGPSSWQVTLGDPAGSPTCSPGASPDGKCGNPNNGSVYNLNFGVTNENVWQQPICSDARFNSGYSQPIPSTASCGGTSAPYAIMACPSSNTTGILFSGNTNPNYGQGTGASTSNYQVGNFSFPESYNYQIPNTSATSYSFVNTSLNTYTGPTTPLKNICPSLTNCVLSEATAGGVYTTTSGDGPVSLSISNVDGTFQLGKANYVFLIGGNLTFTTNLITQNGYSTTFISGGDIHVAGNVGESSWTSTTPDLEGFFSANNNFDIDTAYPAGQQCQANGQPLEKKLNIVGSVITNSGGTGGTIVNNRDGCLQDLSCPALTVTSNPIMILNASGVLKPPYTFWQEQNP